MDTQAQEVLDKKILENLISIVKVYKTIHYKQATKSLIRKGVWGEDVPPTPEMTVNNYFTTSRDENGLPVFERVSAGTYQLRPVYY